VVDQIPAQMKVVLCKGIQNRTFISVGSTCSRYRPYYIGWKAGKLSGWTPILLQYTNTNQHVKMKNIVHWDVTLCTLVRTYGGESTASICRKETYIAPPPTR